MSDDELTVLAKGYNWWGRHQEAFQAINTAVERRSGNEELLLVAVVYIRNAHPDTNSLLATYDDYIHRQIGPAWFWRVQKARECEFVATYDTDLEDYEWEAGDDIARPEALERAIDELIRAAEGGSQARRRVAEHLDEQPALRQSPRFDELLAKIQIP